MNQEDQQNREDTADEDGQSRPIDLDLFEDIDRTNRKLFSPDEAKRLLTLPDRLPEYFYRILGEENIDKLMRILSAPDNIDLDMLALTEPMGIDAAIQYMACLPEFGKFRLELRDIAQDFIKSMVSGGRMNHYLKKSVGVHKIKKDDGKFVTRTYIRNDVGIVELFRLIEKLAKTLSVQVNTPNFRYGRLQEMVAIFQQSLYPEALKVFDEYLRTECKQESLEWQQGLRNSFIKTLRNSPSAKSIRTTEDEKIKVGTSIDLLIEAQRKHKNFLYEHRVSFNSIAESNRDGDLKEKNDLKAQEIARLSQMRKIEGRYKKVGDMKFVIIPIPKSNRPITICGVVIIFDPSAKEGVNMEAPSMVFVLDRADLKFRDIPGVSELDTYFTPKIREAVRSIFFDLILEDLRSKPENIEDLLIGSTAVEDTTAEVKEDVATVQEAVPLPEEPEEETDPEMPRKPEGWIGKNLRRIRRSFQQKVEETIQTAPTQQQPVPRKRKNLYSGVDFNRFYSLPGTQVYRILTQILGEPVRIHGSHHMFKGPNEKVLPIPIHFDTTANPFILTNALEEWGIVKEFYDRLT